MTEHCKSTIKFLKIFIKVYILQFFRNDILSANQCHWSVLHHQGKSQSKTDFCGQLDLIFQKKKKKRNYLTYNPGLIMTLRFPSL